jgi:hypothetical protein
VVVRNVVVAPLARRRGVGAALLLAVVARARALGATRWALNVRPDNAPALALYGRLGLALRHRSVALRVPWAMLSRLPRRALTVATPTPDELPRLEAALGVPGGLLAALGGRLVRWVHDDGGMPLALGAYAPDFPGVAPLRAKEPEALRALLEAFAEAAPRKGSWVQLFVEGDDALATALRVAGAEVRLEVLNLAGALPPAVG